MATGDTILEGLGGLQFSAADNPFGLGTATLAASLPKLIDVEGKFGTNLGIALGGTLLTALMGYQAQRTAADLTSRATSVGLDILAAETPEQRKALAEAADEGFYGGEIKSKALNLVGALEGQKKIDELAAQQTYANKLKELEALTSDPGKAYTQQQLDMALGKIGAQGAQQRLTEADRAMYKAANIRLKADVDARLGWINKDIKVKLAAQLAEDRVRRQLAGIDPDIIESTQLAYTKSIIDKARDEQNQVYDLQKIEFENKLKSAASAKLPEKDLRDITNRQDVANQAYALAQYIEDNIKSYPELYMGKNYSAANDDSFGERLEMFARSYMAAQSGMNVTKQEAEAYNFIIKGDRTAGLESIKDNLRMLADKQLERNLNALSSIGRDASDIYKDIITSYTTKSPKLMQQSLSLPETPSRPAPATIGGGLLGGLTGAPSGKQAQILALQAQAQQVVDAVNSGAMTFEAGSAQAKQIKAQIDALQGGM